MSTFNKETITCPKCGKEIDVIVWKSVNADQDPEAKSQLLDGTLFSFKCGHCGYKGNLDHEMLYHDMQRKVFVSYIPDMSVEKKVQMLTEIRTMLGISMDGYKIRFVADRNQIRDKALIFDLGWDDRVIEVCKIIMIAQAQNAYPGIEISAMYFDANEGQYSFAIFGSKPLTAVFSAEAYLSMNAELAQWLAKESGDDVVIDHDWAMALLQKINNRQ